MPKAREVITQQERMRIAPPTHEQAQSALVDLGAHAAHIARKGAFGFLNAAQYEVLF